MNILFIINSSGRHVNVTIIIVNYLYFFCIPIDSQYYSQVIFSICILYYNILTVCWRFNHVTNNNLTNLFILFILFMKFLFA